MMDIEAKSLLADENWVRDKLATLQLLVRTLSPRWRTCTVLANGCPARLKMSRDFHRVLGDVRCARLLWTFLVGAV